MIEKINDEAIIIMFYRNAVQLDLLAKEFQKISLSLDLSINYEIEDFLNCVKVLKVVINDIITFSENLETFMNERNKENGK